MPETYKSWKALFVTDECRFLVRLENTLSNGKTDVPVITLQEQTYEKGLKSHEQNLRREKKMVRVIMQACHLQFNLTRVYLCKRM